MLAIVCAIVLVVATIYGLLGLATYLFGERWPRRLRVTSWALPMAPVIMIAAFCLLVFALGAGI